MGEALTLVSGVSQADAEHQSGKFQGRIQGFNAKIADLQAKDAIYRGEIDAGKVSSMVRRTIGAQRSSAAAQGVVVDNASPLIRDSERAGAADITQIRNNAAREAWGLRTQATNSRIQGRFDRFTGNQQATGTLLTSGAKAYEQYQERAALGAGGI